MWLIQEKILFSILSVTNWPWLYLNQDNPHRDDVLCTERRHRPCMLG